jgi:hypothetical protein
MDLQPSGLLYTAHARARMRQRAIDPDVVECIVDFGRAEHQPGGSSIAFLDKRARRRIERGLGGGTLKRLGNRVGAYAVVAPDGAVITVGHRIRRIRRYS